MIDAKLLDVRKKFEDSPYFQFLGIEILSFEEGNVETKLQVKEDFMNTNGTLHGGVHASMIDFVMGMTIVSKTKIKCNTMNLNIHYIKPVLTGDIFAKGFIVHEGYKTIVVEGILYDKEGELIAKGSGTFKLMRGK
ncbi:acyl-CoA thioesterase [Oikeobacillus pervagus]|uniref:Medium/long-chain acyl-CoA thioesterase YigI n=1 Tax=Oikeobacillus pervagus TaxID=1325931 RepID=A0AAJ1WII4_9BACI|nr:PaaI family thioesterase [Oikeobacillus pervagus]MDQ0214650.1 acyl-CoA thioesterase [Oikeobacillus pervagus]